MYSFVCARWRIDLLQGCNPAQVRLYCLLNTLLLGAIMSQPKWQRLDKGEGSGCKKAPKTSPPSKTNIAHPHLELSHQYLKQKSSKISSGTKSGIYQVLANTKEQNKIKQYFTNLNWHIIIQFQNSLEYVEQRHAG